MRFNHSVSYTLAGSLYPTYQYLDGEEGDKGGEGDKSGEGEGDKSGEGEGDKGSNKTYTQAEFDQAIEKRNKKDKDKNVALTTQLKQLQSSSNLTTSEKEGLATRIEELETSMLTKDEQTAREKQQADQKHDKELKSSNSERDLWQGRFTDALIDQSLADAAVVHNAESPEQIRMMFRGAVSLDQDKDDNGKPMDSFTPRLKFMGSNPDDTEKVMPFDLPVAEAIAKIRADGLNKNLFKHGSTEGTGQQASGAGGKGGDPSKMPMLEDFGGSTEKYGVVFAKWRKKHNLDGTPIADA